MIKIGEVKNRGKQSTSQDKKLNAKNFASPILSANSMRKNSHQPFSVRIQCEKISHRQNSMRKISHRSFLMRTHWEIFRTANSQCEKFRISFAPAILTAKKFASASHRQLSMQKFSHHHFASESPISHQQSPFRISKHHFASAKRQCKKFCISQTLMRKISHQPLAM